MAYTEVFYPKLPMEGCADRIQDVIVRSGFSNGQVSERYRLETPGGSVLFWCWSSIFTEPEARWW